MNFCSDCKNKNCPEEMPDPNSMACRFFIGKENVCKNCKHFAPKTTHCKKGFPWISEDDSCNNFEQKPKMTNGDKIRQMSNRELAELITPKVMFCNGCPVKCAEKDIPQRDKNDPFGADVAGDVCVKRVEQWLNSKVEE